MSLKINILNRDTTIMKIILLSFVLYLLMIKSVFCCPLEREFRDAMDRLETRVQARLESKENENSVIVIGLTRTGKSALISFLAGEELEVQKADTGKLVLDGHLSSEIVIGHGIKTGTLVPGSHYMEVPHKLTLWDCPGFGDLRGSPSDIVNAASIARVLDAAENVKVVIVVRQSDVIEGRQETCRLFNDVADRFADPRQLQEMVSLIITNAEVGQTHDLKGYASGLTNGLSIKGRELVCYLVSNPDRIGYFFKPSTAGKYGSVCQPLWEVIDRTRFVRHPDTLRICPAGGKDYLKNLSDDLNLRISQELGANKRTFIDSFRSSLDQADLTTIRQISEDKIRSLTSIRTVSPAREEYVRVFSRMDLLPLTVRKSLVANVEQIHTLRTICEDAGVIEFDSRRWFGALEDTLESFTLITDLTERSMELDFERGRYQDMLTREAISQAAIAQYKAEVQRCEGIINASQAREATLRAQMADEQTRGAAAVAAARTDEQTRTVAAIAAARGEAQAVQAGLSAALREIAEYGVSRRKDFFDVVWLGKRRLPSARDYNETLDRIFAIINGASGVSGFRVVESEGKFRVTSL